jgi:voltage-gated potassium channel
MRESKYSSILKYAKIRYAIIIMLVIILIGIVGYMILEDATFLDALYMTVITVSTVGYQDALTLDQSGKIFTIILILVSWVTFAYAISVITSHFVEGELGIFLASYRNKSKLSKMKNHTIVIGYGRNGKNACDLLLAHGQQFVIIEKNHEVVMENVSKKLHFLEGDATEDRILHEAHIEQAEALISTLPIDADNLFITISARSINPNLRIVSRSSDEITSRKLMKAGATHAVLPESVGGHRMAMLVEQPDVVGFFEKISLIGDAETNLVEIMCDNLPEELINHTIYELGIRNNTGANIIGYKTPEGEYVINPTPDTKMIKNAKLFVLGTPEQIKRMKDLMKFD